MYFPIPIPMAISLVLLVLVGCWRVVVRVAVTGGVRLVQRESHLLSSQDLEHAHREREMHAQIDT